jgi:hypothetical protein
MESLSFLSKSHTHTNQCTISQLAAIGDLEGVKYLFSVFSVVVTADSAAHFDDCLDAMNQACGHGHLEIVKFLHLEITKIINTEFFCYNKDDVDGDYGVAITKACEKGHLEIVKYLLSIGKKSPRFAMDVASKNGHLDLVKYLKS